MDLNLIIDEHFEYSSNSRQETMVEKSFDQTYDYESIKNRSLSEGEKSKPCGRLIKTTSTEREEHAEAKGSETFARSKSKKIQAGRLGRAPSLPASLELMEEFEFEFEDEESEFRMGKLIRQASLVDSDMFTPSPRHTSSKAMAQSCSKPRNEPGRRKKPGPALKTLNREGLEQMRKQYLASQSKTSNKSLTDLELQGFKDLGFNFDIVQDLNPSLLPGSKEKKRVESEEENMRSPRYLSEACMPQSSSSSSSSSSSTTRSAEDMKKQIKFWARAVASNWRQEC